jgi:hypothetical protein
MMRTLIAGRDFSGRFLGSLDIRLDDGELGGGTRGRPMIVIASDVQTLRVNADQLLDVTTINGPVPVVTCERSF